MQNFAPSSRGRILEKCLKSAHPSAMGVEDKKIGKRRSGNQAPQLRSKEGNSKLTFGCGVRRKRKQCDERISTKFIVENDLPRALCELGQHSSEVWTPHAMSLMSPERTSYLPCQNSPPNGDCANSRGLEYPPG